MADEKVMVQGIRVFDKNANAPDFVRQSLVISLNEFFQFAKDNAGLQTEYNGAKQLKIQILQSKAGGLYCVVDSYKPEEKTVKNTAAVKKAVNDLPELDDSLPF